MFCRQVKCSLVGVGSKVLLMSLEELSDETDIASEYWRGLGVSEQDLNSEARTLRRLKPWIRSFQKRFASDEILPARG